MGPGISDRWRVHLTPGFAIVLAALATASVHASDTRPSFALHDGDRVVFYGDSITQDGGYCRLVEEFVRCHYPRWNVRFYDAGVGGDKVSGGWAGNAEVRVQRDVIALKPTVVTIMLGMNDGGYRKLEQPTLDAFTSGYRDIVRRVSDALPGARIYLIRTSPFDDITRPVGFDKGYDAVLGQLGDAVSAIAAEKHLQVVDFGKSLDFGLAELWGQNPDLAKQLLPDRVHPGSGGQIAMGCRLLHAWNAPSTVARVVIDGAAGTATASENARVDGLTLANGVLAWKETDQSLPLPRNFEDSDVSLAQKVGANLESLDSEPLVVTGLTHKWYVLHIDDQEVATFSAGALDSGVNLARLNTPMRQQANQVHWSVDDGLHEQLMRRQMLAAQAKGLPGAGDAAQTLASYNEAEQAACSAFAVPMEHRFTLSPLAD